MENTGTGVPTSQHWPSRVLQFRNDKRIRTFQVFFFLVIVIPIIFFRSRLATKFPISFQLLAMLFRLFWTRLKILRVLFALIVLLKPQFGEALESVLIFGDHWKFRSLFWMSLVKVTKFLSSCVGSVSRIMTRHLYSVANSAFSWDRKVFLSNVSSLNGRVYWGFHPFQSKWVFQMLPIQLVVHLSSLTLNWYFTRIAPLRKVFKAQLGESWTGCWSRLTCLGSSFVRF